MFLQYVWHSESLAKLLKREVLMKNIMDAFGTSPTNICRNFLSNLIGCLADMKIDKSKTIYISDQIWWKINAIMCKKQSYTNNPTTSMNDATS